MPGHKKRRSQKKRSAGWVNDRLKFETDPADLYPLSRAHRTIPEKNGFADEEKADPESGEEPADELIPLADAKKAPAEIPDDGPDPEAQEPEDSESQEPEFSESQEPVFVTEPQEPEETEAQVFEDSGVLEPEYTRTQEAGYIWAQKPEDAGAQEPGDREDVSAEEAAAVQVLSRRERFRRFWTKQRIGILRMVIRTAVIGFFAVLFLMPIVLTITNSLMTKSEINANYGVIFAKRNGVRVFISSTVNLKFIPDIVSFEQYFKVLILSPEYLLKFWNSVIYVVPIVVFQLAVASLASYGFARYRSRVREIIFFAYIILMLMPYQVTLVPNYLVSSWLNILGTRWAIWLPGFFSPFAVYMLTKYMRRIPRSIYEAAEIDGAGEWQIFTKICLPNCRGGLASIAILLFIDYWNMVEQPLILLSNDQLHPLSVFLSKINSGEISLAFAVAVIYMVLPMMVFLYGEEYLVEGIVYQGGIKE